MSKWYLVKVKSVSMVVVEVGDKDEREEEIAQAEDVAMNNTLGDDIEAQIEIGPLSGVELDRAKRHADTVLPL